MPERHLQRPGNTGPKTEGSEKRRWEAEIFLDEERADDTCQTRNPGGHVDHERGQEGEPQFPSKFEDVMVYPAVDGSEHGVHL